MPSKPDMPECWYCGRKHELRKRELCPAFGKLCNKCHKPNHFANKCRSTAVKGSVKLVDDNGDEVFPTQIAAVSLDDSQFVTLKLKSGNFLRFQVDTGAQCNVIPLALYRQATNDHKLRKAKLGTSQITAYGGTTLPVTGQVLMEVERGNRQYTLECKLVNCTNIRPLLGRKACLDMEIVAYLDNDALCKPHVGQATVFTLEPTNAMSQQQLIKKYPTVFKEGVGKVAGDYHIRLDSSVQPVQHAPRRVPVALRQRLKETLNSMVRANIIAPVTEPTSWISSMVAVPKKNGTLRICLDPKDLNTAIQREHYPLPTIEDVATRLYGAKVFSVLDVRSGFWHITLDESSSFLTTFHTPFGRYRWKRMPFGICSAPEVFQRRMHELIEGLTGVEVIADDFVVVGRGQTEENAIHDHDKNLEVLLQRCEERGVRLNADKLKLRMQEVPFIGHIATQQGLCVDPAKVQAIKDMPLPKNVAGVQRLLGLTQYLSKFLPHLSDITKPMRELTQKDTVWAWEHPQQEALDKLKEAVMSTPVLRYYNLNEEVTLQCDASQSGLGAAMMQNGQPVAYASRALSEVETRYAQIEKELLAVVFACDHFDAYIYGRSRINIETDHKPLESIVLKPLHNAPQRLQRMLLKLQKYNLQWKYKKGTTMFLADTLSRAHLPDVGACDIASNLEGIDHTTDTLLAVSKDRLLQIKHASSDDPVLQILRETIQQGWPENKRNVPTCIRAYDFRDELTIQDQLVFKGSRVVIPVALRREMMAMVHASHIGIEGSIRRARDSLYWPRMNAELREYVSKCDICLAHRTSQGKEPLLSHEIPERPWARIGVDLCELKGRTLLVVCDYYSNFIEVERIHTPTTQGVSKVLKCLFSRYGVPDIVISDNGPQFSSAEFARTWHFTHTTTSPYYPQSNGKAENAVKTIKRLFAKCQEAGQSEHLALLDWRNTPTEGMGTSPAQRFLGRRCKTLLPITKTLLSPRYPIKQDIQELQAQKERQQQYYNQHGRDLRPISPGETVRIRLPGQKTWSVGICKALVGPRSYEVNVGNTIYRRNRRHVIHTDELFDTENMDPQTVHPEEGMDNGSAPMEQDGTSTSLTTAVPQEPCTLRRSQRTHRAPHWMEDYIQS